MIGKRVVSLMRVGTIPTLQKKVPPHNDSSDEEPFTRLMNNVGPNQTRGRLTLDFLPVVSMFQVLQLGKSFRLANMRHMLAYKEMNSGWGSNKLGVMHRVACTPIQSGCYT